MNAMLTMRITCHRQSHQKNAQNEEKHQDLEFSAISAIKHGIPRFISISAKNRGIAENRGVLNSVAAELDGKLIIRGFLLHVGASSDVE
jgi:hypothetical protein